MVMCVENRSLISFATPDSITCAHDFSELIKGLEYMNSNTPVEHGGLQQPQVLTSVTALSDLVWRLDRLLFGLLHFDHLLINHLEIIGFVLVYDFVQSQEHLDFVSDVFLQVIKDNGQWHRVVDVLLLTFVILLHI